LLRTPKLYPTAVDQMRELTELRAELPWMEDVPCDIGQAVLKDLHNAWQRCFHNEAGRPHIKAKGRDSVGLTEAGAKAWSIKRHRGQDVLVFPKIGYVPVVLDRPLQGRRTSATIKRDGDQWFVSIHTEREVADPAVPRGGPIALDLGVSVAVADSQGGFVDNPRLGAAMAPTIAKRSRALGRKKKGSNNRAKARARLAKAHQKLRRQREHFAHCVSKHYAKNHSVLVLEELRVKNMTASAKGTVEEPGAHVQQKAGLNRAILDVAPHRLRTLCTYKARRYGGQVVLVPAAHSSQTCAECGFVAAENRRERDFKCLYCGYSAHADTNAARVLLHRYTRRTGGGEVCGGYAEGRPERQKPKAVRSRTPKRTARLQSPVVHDGDGLRASTADRRPWSCQFSTARRPAPVRGASSRLYLEMHPMVQNAFS
jgi:putative transposase